MLYTLIDLMCAAVFAVPLSWLFLAFSKTGSKKRFLLMTLFTLYLCEMFDVVGIPAVQYIRWEPAVNLVPFGDEKNFRFFLQLGLNAVMFLPFGFFLPLLWSKCRRWHRTALAGFLTSLTIELTQLLSFRATDVDDLLMNTLGAVLGYFLARVCFHKKWAADTEPAPGRVSQTACVVVSILIPFFVLMFLRTPLSGFVYGLHLFNS